MRSPTQVFSQGQWWSKRDTHLVSGGHGVSRVRRVRRVRRVSPNRRRALTLTLLSNEYGGAHLLQMTQCLERAWLGVGSVGRVKG